jgi:hypothetical protein
MEMSRDEGAACRVGREASGSACVRADAATPPTGPAVHAAEALFVFAMAVLFAAVAMVVVVVLFAAVAIVAVAVVVLFAAVAVVAAEEGGAECESSSSKAPMMSAAQA